MDPIAETVKAGVLATTLVLGGFLIVHVRRRAQAKGEVPGERHGSV